MPQRCCLLLSLLLLLFVIVLQSAVIQSANQYRLARQSSPVYRREPSHCSSQGPCVVPAGWHEASVEGRSGSAASYPQFAISSGHLGVTKDSESQPVRACSRRPRHGQWATVLLPARIPICLIFIVYHTHTYLTAFYPGLSGWAGTRKVKPMWILLKQRDSEWQWHQLGHMQVCTSLQRDTTPAPHHSVFTCQMPFQSPNQQSKSTEGKVYHFFNNFLFMLSVTFFHYMRDLV